MPAMLQKVPDAFADIQVLSDQLVGQIIKECLFLISCVLLWAYDNNDSVQRGTKRIFRSWQTS